VALQGDASSEELLRAANVEEASTVLISLTVRSLAPDVHLVAAAREEENIKLLYGAGADLVVAPSVSGGRLMGAAVRQHAVPQFLEDLLSFGEGLAMGERIVLPDLTGALVLGAARGRERCPFHQLPCFRLRAGDVIVYLTGEEGCVEDAEPVSPEEIGAPSA
jgi:voltage-gated potassium channel Kch